MVETDLTTEDVAGALRLNKAALSGIEDFAHWEQLLLAEDNLADVPAIPLEAMRRENMYADHH